jgi:dienelactone hydrolase
LGIIFFLVSGYIIDLRQVIIQGSNDYFFKSLPLVIQNTKRKASAMTDLNAFYHALYQSTPAAFSFNAETPAELSSWQAAFHPRLLEVLGITQMQQDLAGFRPGASLVDVQPKDGYTLEQWRIEVEPGLRLPFYLLRPQHTNGPLPLVLTPHGHNQPHLYAGLYTNEEERELIKGDRDIAVQAVKEGYLAIAPTARGFGDTRTEEDRAANNLSSCRSQLMHGLLLGRTPIGERVWDISCLLSWALENLEIDSQRIAITGNSGGGTISVFAAACDRRISVAAPGSYFCTFTDSIGSIFHCDCNYVPGILRLGEMYDVAGLIAPRPFCAIAGELDEIFPISAVRYAYQMLQKVYTVAGCAENCQLYVGEGGHRYYKAGAWPFIRKAFNNTRV